MLPLLLLPLLLLLLLLLLVTAVMTTMLLVGQLACICCGPLPLCSLLAAYGDTEMGSGEKTAAWYATRSSSMAEEERCAADISHCRQDEQRDGDDCTVRLSAATPARVFCSHARPYPQRCRDGSGDRAGMRLTTAVATGRQ